MEKGAKRIVVLVFQLEKRDVQFGGQVALWYLGNNIFSVPRATQYLVPQGVSAPPQTSIPSFLPPEFGIFLIRREKYRIPSSPCITYCTYKTIVYMRKWGRVLQGVHQWSIVYARNIKFLSRRVRSRHHAILIIMIILLFFYLDLEKIKKHLLANERTSTHPNSSRQYRLRVNITI